MSRIAAFLTVIVIVFNFTSISLFSLEKVGKITGTVVNKTTQNPIPGITVRLLETSKGAVTDNSGKFKIAGIKPGIYAVQFTAIGYEKYVQSNVSVTTGRPADLQIEMTETVIELEGAEVRASYFTKQIETATSTQRLSSEEIRRAPGVQEDIVRATALLPGVNVTAAGRNDLIVRGGAPFENLFLVDNIEVSNINHFGSQGSTGGPLSIINLDFVRNVNFSAGGFGAKYGNKLSSITDITMRKGNEEKFGGKVNLSATGFGVNIEGPISDKGSYFFSVRRSYLDLLFDLAGFGFVPQYWDFQGKIHYRADDKNIIEFMSIWALDDVKLNNDNFDNRANNAQVAVPNQRQYFSGITWKHLFEKGFSKVTLGRDYTRYSIFQNDSNLTEIFRNDSEEGEIQLKADLTYQLAKRTELRVGNQTKFGAYLKYDVLVPGFLRTDDMGNPRPLDKDTTFNTWKNGTYASLTLPIGNHRLTAGGRMDYYSYTKDKFFFSPRASFVYFLNPVSSFTASAGRYYQPPSFVWLVGGTQEQLNPIIADQAVIGYDHTPLQDVKVQVEAYYKSYQNYPAKVWRPQAILAPSGFENIQAQIPSGLEPLANEGEGRSYGAELFIQKKLSDIPIYGLLSLSYSKTKFRSIDNEWRWSPFDSRWVFNISGGWRINQEWEISSKFRFATGVPTTPYYTTGNNAGRINFSEFTEGERIPNFHSLDIRVDKRWIFEKLTLITYIDVQNVYGRENVSGLSWNPIDRIQEYNRSIGVLPSIGISIDF